VAQIRSIKGAEVPAAGTAHYLPCMVGKYATNFTIANVKTPSHNDSNSTLRAFLETITSFLAGGAWTLGPLWIRY